MTVAEDQDGGGPWLQIAAFCEKVLRERDGVNSLVRVIDRISGTFVPEEPGVDVVHVPLQVYLVLSWRAGSYRGTATVKLRHHDPRTDAVAEHDLPSVEFKEDDGGAMAIATFFMAADHAGSHWFDVLLNDELQTRIPLLVEQMRPESPQSGEDEVARL